MADISNVSAAAWHHLSTRIFRIFRFLVNLRLAHVDRDAHRKARRSLSSLPVEILLHIVDFLPPSSAACLVLCSRDLFTIFGCRFLHSLRAPNAVREKRRFLVALQKDLPDWLLCYPCSVFHPVKADEGPKNPWLDFEGPSCVQANGVVYLALRFRLQYQHAQLLMDRYRFGRPCKESLARLSHTYSHTLSDTVFKSDIRAEIVAGELVVHVYQKLRLLGQWNMELIKHRMDPICPHLELFSRDQILWQTIGCRLSHMNDLPRAKCSMWRSCQECRTRFQVDVQELENLQVEIQVYASKYLGPCETPYDPKWREQAEPRCRKATRIPTTAAQWASEA